jgi:hypothetical protein
MKKISIHKLFACCLCAINSLLANDPTTLANSDPLPLFTAQYPYSYLGLKERQFIQTHGKTKERPSHLGITITPFYQRATTGKNWKGEHCELGDIHGEWNMLAILNDQMTATLPPPIENPSNSNPIPCGGTVSSPTHLQELLTLIGQETLLSWTNVLESQSAASPIITTMVDLLDLQQSTSVLAKTLGFFSVKGKYYKRGVRFDINSIITGGLGFSIKTGLAQVSFCPTFVDKTPEAAGTEDAPINPLFEDNPELWKAILKGIQRSAMAQLGPITKAMGLNICPYRSNVELEDVYGEFFWRHPIEINKHQSSEDWTLFLFIPMITFGGSLNLSKATDPADAFAVPVGNNGHNSWYVRGGIALDFFETVEIAADIGFTGFNSRKVSNMFIPNTNPDFTRVPYTHDPAYTESPQTEYPTAYPSGTNTFQSGIFPCRISACVTPGRNFDFGLSFNAYRFMFGAGRPLDRLSFYLQYRYVTHQQDEIKTVQEAACCDTTNYIEGIIERFMPEAISCRSGFTVQVFNFGFNYDISPNIVLNFGAQTPFKRKGAFRSTTLLGGLEMTF